MRMSELKLYKMQGKKVAYAIVAPDLEHAYAIVKAAFNYTKHSFDRTWESCLFSDKNLKKYTKGYAGYFTGVMEDESDERWRFVRFNIRHHYIDIALEAL